jgi:hypothetical protein
MTFIKEYTDPSRAAAARAHRQWLAALDSGIRLPGLNPGGSSHLVFEHLDGVFPQAEDLLGVAEALGDLHAVAYRRELHAARLDQAFHCGTGLVIADFLTPRPSLPVGLAAPWAGLPVALYKDTNLRNVILTIDGPALVDFDDLTLAPFGYDLAKLVVSIAMTYGRVPESTITTALDAYNSRAAGAAGPAARCPLDRFRQFAEVHHQLTAVYLGRHGYQYPWTAVRPWPHP